MITIKNYFQKIKEISPSKIPAKLKEGYNFVKEVTEGHTTWKYYQSDADIKSAVDEYIATLSTHLRNSDTSKANPKDNSGNADAKEAHEIAKRFIKTYVLRGDSVSSLNQSQMGTSNSDFDVDIRSNKINVRRMGGKKVQYSFPLKKIYDEILASHQQPKKSRPKTTKANNKKEPSARQPATQKVNDDDSKPVEKIDEAVRFIKRFVSLHGKTRTAAQISGFINSLQRAIVEKRIRKTSPYARQIEYIQTGLIGIHQKMGATATIKIRDSVYAEMQQIAGSEKVRLSISYMKRYISLQGKTIDKEKAKKLHNLIATAVNAGKITGNDPYMDKINRVLRSLRTFVQSASKNDTVNIHEAVLNGLDAALDGCACGCSKCGSLDGCNCQQLNGPEARPRIMNSMDFAELKFETLGFQGKWRDLIGDPSRNFTAMVFGKPKLGKSWLCLDFGGYLARNHGKVLYVAKEEGLDLTLQEKVENVKHPNMTVSEFLPYDELDGYDFIFLDSVSRLGLTPDELNQLRADHPTKSFIFIFQTTKAGAFRGANTFQHDVDVVIEVPERGKAVQMGRFNQGGEMDIFDSPLLLNAA